MAKVTPSLSTNTANNTDGETTPRTVHRRILTRRSAVVSAPVPTIKNAIKASELPSLIDAYLDSSLRRRHSTATLENKKVRLRGLEWLSERRGWKHIGKTELEVFFLYLAEGHKDPEGRWGNPQLRKPTSSGTAISYDSTYRAFFTWLVQQEELTQSPMDKVEKVIDRPDQIQPFTPEQVLALYGAAGRTMYPERDQAILLLLLNSGLRASELCSLKHTDFNLRGAKVLIREGKGGKSRTVPLTPDTVRAINGYRDVLGSYNEDDDVFVSEKGRDTGTALKRDGLKLLFYRLRKAARIVGVRCSPHTCRHTFAITYLRPVDKCGFGGNLLQLQAIMGHESPKILKRYVALAEADIAEQHRGFELLKVIKNRRTVRASKPG